MNELFTRARELSSRSRDVVAVEPDASRQVVELLAQHSDELVSLVASDYEHLVQLAASAHQQYAILLLYQAGARHRGVLAVDKLLHPDAGLLEKFSQAELTTPREQLAELFSPFRLHVCSLRELLAQQSSPEVDELRTLLDESADSTRVVALDWTGM